MDPTQLIPERLKEKLADGLVELLAGSAERLGGGQIAGNIRKFSSRGDLLQSVDCALEVGVRRFVKDYVSQDEDLVAAIQADDLFWQSEVVQDALVRLVSRPSAWLGEERETVLRHFETVLPTRVNRGRVDKAVTFLLRCIAEELWSLPGAQEIREAYSIQFQELSAEAQREGVALARQQLQATTQMNAGLQQALLQLIGLVEQKVLAAPAPVAVLASPRPYHNLPQPIYTQFVGREEELAWLRQRLSPEDRAWQVAITGVGGVGKSALALAVAWEYQLRYNELPSEARFEAIVWISAKEEVLTAFGREPADVPEQVLHRLEDVYTAIAHVLEREDITRAQPEEQNALVKSALKRQRTLLIMDNLESVKDDRIKAFLRNLPRGTKAIITSRESLDVANVRFLTGLPWEKAEALIEEECREREVSLMPQQRKRIFELTSGLPLPIKLSIARMAGGESYAAVERWLGDAAGELPEYCVKGQIDLVRDRDPNAWTVLLACALFDREAGASREALGVIADLSTVDRDTALAHLQRLFLTNHRKGDRFWVLPIVQRFVSEESRNTLEAQTTTLRWVGWLGDFVQEYGPMSEADMKAMEELGQEYPNLRAAIFWCHDRELHTDLLRLCDGTWHYPLRFSLMNDLERIVDIWLDSAARTEEKQAEGRAFLGQATLYWVCYRKACEALSCLDCAEPILEESADYPNLAKAWETRASIKTELGIIDEAGELGYKIYELGKHTGSTDITLLGIQRSAATEGERGQSDLALQWCNKGMDFVEQASPPVRANMLYRKGKLLMKLAQYEEAEALFLALLELEAGIGARHYFVESDKLRLAQIYAATSRPEAARRTAEEVHVLAKKHALSSIAEEASKLLSILSRSARTSADALETPT